VVERKKMLKLTQYVKVVATGAIGRIEQWTQATNQYLEAVEPPNDAQ
jgi:hypothetical protein